MKYGTHSLMPETILSGPSLRERLPPRIPKLDENDAEFLRWIRHSLRALQAAKTEQRTGSVTLLLSVVDEAEQLRDLLISFAEDLDEQRTEALQELSRRGVEVDTFTPEPSLASIVNLNSAVARAGLG